MCQDLRIVDAFASFPCSGVQAGDCLPDLSMRNNLVWRKAVILLLVWMLPAGAQQDQRVLVEAGAK